VRSVDTMRYRYDAMQIAVELNVSIDFSYCDSKKRSI
jgi:hypothetical protein